MAKKAKNSDGGDSQPGGETTQGYFRRIFAENPELLKNRSNDKLLKRWLADHPGHEKVPANVKAGLSNVKSVLRSRGRKRRARKAAEATSRGEPLQNHARASRTSKPTLATLEEAIDDCMTLAKVLDRDRLDNIISHLRRARNEVVWKLGK